jgi:hypothetical protein
VLLAVTVCAPGALAAILLDRPPGDVNGVVCAVGVRLTVIVAVPPEFSVPMLHVTVELTTVPQLPTVVVIELNVAPVDGSASVTMIPLVASPALMSV